MPTYAYVVLYPPELAEGLDARLKDAGFRQTAHDPDSGGVLVTGSFEDEETAISQLSEAFPGPEGESGPQQSRTLGLTASPGLEVIQAAMQLANGPVPGGGSPVAIPVGPHPPQGD